MRLLVIGGTRFLGRHLVESALARGHGLTLFHRGRTQPGLFPEAEEVLGDRGQDLERLPAGPWDAVIDTCGYVPRIVAESARALADSAGRYLFVSTISVYAEGQPAGGGEEAPLARLADETTEAVSAETYGGLKALCEATVAAAFPGRALILRPGLIVGPWDPTDRFTYWPERIARGGEVLAPGDPAQAVQLIDARDLADWTIRLLEAGATGTLNAVGPERPLAMGRLLETCLAEAGSGARLTWVEEAFLLAEGARPWSELPLWLPAADAAAALCGNDRALAAGLSFRSLAATVRDTLAWAQGRGGDPARAAGLAPEREAELLRRWHARRPA